MKVVCINGNFRPENMFGWPIPDIEGSHPQKGMTYTVIGYKPDPAGRVRGFYFLEGFDPISCWNMEKFRPVTDISDLEKLCEVEPLKQVEPV